MDIIKFSFIIITYVVINLAVHGFVFEGATFK